MKLVLAGGSGFLGHALAAHFRALGWEVVVLTRSPRAGEDGVRQVFWDTATVGEWKTELDGADAVVNLAGRSVNCRYHERNRREILESRVNSTRAIGLAIGQCTKPQRVWLNASTATIYKHTLGAAMDESGQIEATPEAKDAFSIEVATAWESTLAEARTPSTRKVAMRAAMVLGTARNSVFPVLRRLVRLGLGGRMGSGRQFVSWIHQRDFCRAVEWLITHDELAGPVNLAAPNPVTNRELMQTLRKVCGVPFGLPAAGWMLEVGAAVLRTETELIIKSRRVVPRRLIESGFAFDFPLVQGAFENLVGR